MEFKITIVNQKIFQKDCTKIDDNTRQKIFQKIEQLKFNPTQNAQIKKLKKIPTADYRLRVGDFRVLFNISHQNQEIFLLRILHRSQVYKS